MEGVEPARLARTIEPMKAVTGELPSDDDTSWAYEVKWDGVRAIGFVEGGRLRLQSSNLIDITDRYPELAPVADEVGGAAAILDGEIVAFNADGRPDFGLLQQRMHINGAKAVAEWSARLPIVWVLFDLLHLDGHSLMVTERGSPHDQAPAKSYENRRRLLEQLVDAGPNWQVPHAQIGDGGQLLRAVTDRGMEGLVAKRVGSFYYPGRRSNDWRKLKIRRRQEFVVAGWKYGEAGKSRSSTIGAILVGYYDEGRLTCAGRVGSGFSDAELRRLERVFADLARDDCPYDVPPTRDEARDAHWVRPEVVVEVAFGEWSSDLRLRHPSYQGQRFDKDPLEVIRET